MIHLLPETTCFAGIEPEQLDLLRRVLKKTNAPEASFEELVDVVAIKKGKPALLICDLDRMRVDALEMVRQLRFVLPEAIIVVYTSSTVAGAALRLHSAGVNCVLSKFSNEEQLARGLRLALSSGCYTDPRMTAA